MDRAIKLLQTTQQAEQSLERGRERDVKRSPPEISLVKERGSRLFIQYTINSDFMAVEISTEYFHRGRFKFRERQDG